MTLKHRFVTLKYYQQWSTIGISISVSFDKFYLLSVYLCSDLSFQSVATTNGKVKGGQNSAALVPISYCTTTCWPIATRILSKIQQIHSKTSQKFRAVDPDKRNLHNPRVISPTIIVSAHISPIPIVVQHGTTSDPSQRHVQLPSDEKELREVNLCGSPSLGTLNNSADRTKIFTDLLLTCCHCHVFIICVNWIYWMS